jgi:tetratricopeptide (TPR) repeat protein
MAKSKNIRAKVKEYCIMMLLLNLPTPVLSQDGLFLYARLRNGFGSTGFVERPKNQWGAMYYSGFGEEPEFEVALANESRKEVTIQWTTPNLVTLVFKEVPGGEWKGKYQFQQLSDHPILESGEQKTPLDTTTVALKPRDMITLTFRIVTEGGEELPPGDYEIEIKCNVKGLAGIIWEWNYQNRLGFEIREPITIAERVSFLSLKARQYLVEKNYGAAEEAINQALQVYPSYSAGHLCLASIRESQGRYAEAIKHQEKAIELLQSRQDYLGTRNRSNTSIEESIMSMKTTLKTLQVRMASQQKRPLQD